MSIFKCTKCGVIENAEWCNFHTLKEDEPAMCSLCDPAINKWHNRFPRALFKGAYDADIHGPLAVRHPHK